MQLTGFLAWAWKNTFRFLEVPKEGAWECELIGYQEDLKCA